MNTQVQSKIFYFLFLYKLSSLVDKGLGVSFQN